MKMQLHRWSATDWQIIESVTEYWRHPKYEKRNTQRNVVFTEGSPTTWKQFHRFTKKIKQTFDHLLNLVMPRSKNTTQCSNKHYQRQFSFFVLLTVQGKVMKISRGNTSLIFYCPPSTELTSITQEVNIKNITEFHNIYSYRLTQNTETASRSIKNQQCPLPRVDRCLGKMTLLIEAPLCELYSDAGISRRNWI
jgi:hypothetical protein